MKLLALRCPECNHSLAPENDHVVVACEFCHTAVQIDDEGMSSLPVTYVRPTSDAEVTEWLPFWVYHGRVHVTVRRVAHGRESDREEAKRMWEEPRDLYVPAWESPVNSALETGRTIILQQPAYQTIEQPADVRLAPVTLTSEDALKLLELIILDIEARRQDWLTGLDFRLDVGEAALWALPAAQGHTIALVE